MPYNSDSTLINSADVDYIDAHLSHSAQHLWFGFYGPRDIPVVETNHPDLNSTFSLPDESSTAITDHLLDFLRHELKIGRMPPQRLTLQSGFGDIIWSLVCESRALHVQH